MADTIKNKQANDLIEILNKENKLISINNNNNQIIYGNVILSLENCILPIEKLNKTPSSSDGLNEDDEYQLRILGCELIQTAGILLKLPQVAMATGQVLFHRFYYSKSFVRYPMEITAMACIACASKIEEAPRRIRDVINVFHHMKQMRSSQTPLPLLLDQNYVSLKNQIIKAERRLLKELGFCVHVKHPHKFIVTLLQVLESEKNQQLMQTAWNYMNDSLRTDVFVRYSPETIACACIYLSARVLRISLPSRPNWFELFNINEVDIRDVCKRILKLYTIPTTDQERLENVVNKLKEEFEKSKANRIKSFLNNDDSNQTVEKQVSEVPAKVVTASTMEFTSNDNKNENVNSNTSAISNSNRSNVNSKDDPKMDVQVLNELPRQYKKHDLAIISRSPTPVKRENWTRERSRSPSYNRHYTRPRSRSKTPIKYRTDSYYSEKRKSSPPRKHKYHYEDHYNDRHHHHRRRNEMYEEPRDRHKKSSRNDRHYYSSKSRSHASPRR